MRTRNILTAAMGLMMVVAVPAQAEDAPPSFNARLEGYAYPFDVEMFGFASQGQSLEMAYMYLPGEADAETIVLLHGKNFNGAYWETTARLLQEEGYGVLIPDQIGFGKSSKPAGYQYSFNQLALNTAQLMDEVGIEKAVILGHSMGGMVASRFALSYPDRVDRLVLVNPIGLEDYLDYTSYPPIDALYKGQLGQTPEGIIAYQKANYYDGDWNETYEALTVPLVGWLNGPDKEALAYTAALTTDMILTQPVIDDFVEIDVPVSLVLGTRDRTAPNRANLREGETRELGRYDRLGGEVLPLLEDGELVELSDLGHLPQIEAFDRFAPVLLGILDEDG